MSFAGDPAGPTIAGYTSFIYNVMGIPVAALPTTSPSIVFSFNVAMSVVNDTFACIGSNAGGSPGVNIYEQMVYLLAGSQLLAFAVDVTSNPPIFPGSVSPTNPNGLPYFQGARAKWNINDFIPGVIQSSSDEGTSQSFVVQKAAENFTLQNLQQLKDPWGRQYLAFAQSYGPSVWGLTC